MSQSDELTIDGITTKVFDWKRNLDPQARMVLNHGSRKSLYDTAIMCEVINQEEYAFMKNSLGKLWDYVGD